VAERSGNESEIRTGFSSTVRSLTSWFWVSVLAVVQSVVVALSMWLQKSSAPILYADEMGYLAAAADLSTRSGEPFLGHTAPYAIGYSILIAGPMSVIGSDPWRIAVGINVIAVVALPLLCFTLIKKLSSVANPVAALIAAAAGAYPATVLQVTRAWPEAVLPSLILAWALLAVAAARNPRLGSLLLLSTSASVLYTVHHRTLAVLIATIGFLVVNLARGVATRNAQKIRLSAVSIATAVALTMAGVAVEASVASKLHLAGSLDRGSQVLTGLHLSHLSFTSQVFVGQVWYLLAASLGLAWLCVVAIRRAMRDRHSDRDWAITIAAAMFGTLLIGSAAIGAGSGTRADTFVYGRYVEVFIPLMIVIAFALARTGSSMRYSASLRTPALAIAPLAVLIVAFHSSDAFTANYQKINLEGILAHELVNGHLGTAVRTRLDLPVIAISVVTLITVLNFVSRRGTGGLAATTWLMFAVMSFLVSAWTLRPWLDIFEQTSVEAASIVKDVGQVGVVVDGPGAIRVESLNALLYRANYPRVELVSGEDCPATKFVAAGDDWSPNYAFESIIGMEPFGGGLYTVRCD